ncbi:MAG: SNF2-related protein [Marinilabiliaceae bacterium]|nr:SNF2-related protein [Marinilabiliaceae bacterium]
MHKKRKSNKLQRIRQPETKVSYHRKPENLGLESWQKALRKQFVVDKYFNITKLDGHPVFSDYKVFNPETKNSYKVALRDNKVGTANSMNFCNCMDFKTNRLGTCKHLEAVLRQVCSNLRLENMLQKGYNPPYTSVYLQYGEQREVKIRIGTEDKQAFSDLASNFFDNNILKPAAYTHFESFLEQARAINSEFRCYDDALEYVLTVREHQRRNLIISERYSTDSEMNLLKTTLFPYQQYGVLFAAKAGRCLIADEMGLGKTIQAIGTAELLKNEHNISNVLIICPTSLKYQWQSEIQKFTDSSVKVIEGAQHIRGAQYKNNEFYKIVSYHAASHDVNNINNAEFDLVILDEAQRIKNWKTKLAQSTKKIKSTYAIVLTGTPLENKLEDLYSIMQFVDPFKLGPYYRFLNYHQITTETGKVTGYQNLHEIGEKMSDIMVRRLKKEVLNQLPERMDKNLFVPMTQKQLDMYIEFQETVARLVSKWRDWGFLSETDRQRLMIALNSMRMLCDSTYILDQDYENRHDTKIEELMNILDEIFESSEDKVVVFSQWKRMTHLVSKELDFRGVPYEHLHGGVPSNKRKNLFDHFNSDPDCRVFLSTDAGSTGLNLQSASLVINLDIPWNPAVLEQRIARVHRMGQKNNVQVINFIAKETIEHRMLFVLGFKSALAQGILDKGEDAIFMDKDSFTKFMETVEAVAGSTEISDEAVVSTDEEMEPIEMGTKLPLIFDEKFIEAQIQSEIEEHLNEGKEKVVLEEKDEVESAENIVDKDDIEDEDLEQVDDIEKENDPLHYVDDDDISPTEIQTPQLEMEKLPTPESPATPQGPYDLLSGGLRFLSGLAQTLSSPEATQKLVSSIVERDEKTGQSYMKIPIDDQQTVVNVVNMLGQLFKGFGK